MILFFSRLEAYLINLFMAQDIALKEVTALEHLLRLAGTEITLSLKETRLESSFFLPQTPSPRNLPHQLTFSFVFLLVPIKPDRLYNGEGRFSDRSPLASLNAGFLNKLAFLSTTLFSR